MSEKIQNADNGAPPKDVVVSVEIIEADEAKLEEETANTNGKNTALPNDGNQTKGRNSAQNGPGVDVAFLEKWTTSRTLLFPNKDSILV